MVVEEDYMKEEASLGRPRSPNLNSVCDYKLCCAVPSMVFSSASISTIRNMNPPWILCSLVILWLGPLSEAADLDSQGHQANTTAKERPQREVTDRERRLIPYMTFYLAHSINNPNSGERENILIPIQAQQANLDQIRSVPQIHTNNLRTLAQTQQYETPATQPAPAHFPDNGFYPTPSIELTPREEYKNREVPVLEQVYRFKPSPQLQQQQQQQLVPQPLVRPAYQLASTRPRVNQKYAEPQIIKISPYNPSYNPYLKPTQTPQHSYTSTRLQNLGSNPYVQENYYKGGARTVVDAAYIPGKVYAVNIIPQSPPKIAIQRLRPRPVPEKSNLNQIFIASTTPTPYRAQVKFELEDARVPSLANGLHLEKVSEPTAVTYSTEVISPNYIGKQGQITESPKKDEQNVYYAHEIRQESPNHVTFVPVRAPPPPLTPETIRIAQVGPIQSTPIAQVEQVRIVPEVSSQRPQVHDTNDIGHAGQDGEYEEYDVGKIVAPEAKSSLDTSVVNLLTILKQTNQLPQNFTPENIDNSIRTLALILERLQNEKKFQSATSKVKSKPKPTVIVTQGKQNKVHNYPNPSGTSTPGRPGIDYPTYATIPQTNFDCSTQRYKGFFGDPDTNCQVWHYCDLNGGQASFLCPNGTIFSQVALTCDWWFNVKCASTSQLYVLNERLYKYILPFSPSFPEDYSGPLVDRYLAAKFREMEAKSRLKALKALISTPKPETPASSTPTADTTTLYNAERK